MRVLATGLLICFSWILFGCDMESDFPVLKGAYLGQELPGEEPRLFAPDVVSTGMYERDVAVSPDRKEMYFGLMASGVATVFGSRQEGGRWTAPEIPSSFAKHPDINIFEPHITPDGNRMLFLCTHPPEGMEPRPGWFYQNIWAVDRQEDGSWSDIYDIGAPINSDDSEYFPSVTRDGTLYFTRSARGSRETQIMRARWMGEGYDEPEALPESVNGDKNIYNAFIDPDERYLIACLHGRDDGFAGGRPNYYVFFRSEDDHWSEAVNLGEKVNPPGVGATSAYVSPDGRYLFFASSMLREEIITGVPLTLARLNEYHRGPENGNSDIYWMDASFIESLRPEGF